MTDFNTVYDVFLAKVLEDEWTSWAYEEVQKDLLSLLKGAISWFKFPRTPLDFNIEETGFVNNLSNMEIQILANYMKCEWLERTIMSWENVKPLYVERDFSQANLIDKLKNLLETVQKKTERLESRYYRTKDGKIFDYSKLAGS